MSDQVRVVEQNTSVHVVDSKPTVRIATPNFPGPVGPAGEGLISGGLAGQHLAKVSTTDFDAQWVNSPFVGNIEILSPIDKELLSYDATSGNWVNLSTTDAEIATFTGDENLSNKTLNAGYF